MVREAKRRRLDDAKTLEAYSVVQDLHVAELLNKLLPPFSQIQSHAVPAQHMVMSCLTLPATQLARKAFELKVVAFSNRRPNLNELPMDLCNSYIGVALLRPPGKVSGRGRGWMREQPPKPETLTIFTGFETKCTRFLLLNLVGHCTGKWSPI